MKSLIVTGGANGLGRSIAESASKAGYRVGILDVNIGALEEAASSIENATPLVASVTSTDEVRAALEEFGQTPDIWVNNAGIVRFAPLLELSEDDWRAVIDINLTGTFICSTIVAEAMAIRGSGSIINITSINGISAGANSRVRCHEVSNFTLTQQMSLEWGKLGLRVNALAPGLIDGGMSEPIYSDPQFRKYALRKCLLDALEQKKI